MQAKRREQRGRLARHVGGRVSEPDTKRESTSRKQRVNIAQTTRQRRVNHRHVNLAQTTRYPGTLPLVG